MARPRVRLIPLVPTTAATARDLQLELADEPLSTLLERLPCLASPSVEEAWRRTPVGDVIIDWELMFQVASPGRWAREGEPLTDEPVRSPPPEPEEAAAALATSASEHPQGGVAFPDSLTDSEALLAAWHDEIEQLAAFLRAGLSVLVSCDKLVVPHLWGPIVQRVRLPTPGGKDRPMEPVVLEPRAGAMESGPLGPSRAQQQIDWFRQLIEDLKPDQVLVVPHLDLLAGGADHNPGREARDIIELAYRAADRLMLAFADPAISLPETLSARFAVRVNLGGVPREAVIPDGSRVPLGQALVTRAQAALFADFDPSSLFKGVAGLNPVRLREALAYAVQVARDRGHGPGNPAPMALLTAQIRAFKAQGSEQFEIPETSFDDIGGYDDVKQTLGRALSLLRGAGHLPPNDVLRSELVPRGFLFHGPPGTGKTLFAKAIARALDGAIRVVSGPEITDKYVGESERRVRELFAEARRNAPSVLVFDEFDAIAARRSGRDDGGSRAGNAIVAQILTEMDGFRADVPMLVIGTTNQLHLIDEALLRPSRFQPVQIDLPGTAARRQIAAIHARHFAVSTDDAPLPDALLDLIANATDGMNGDEIRSVFRDACVERYVERLPIDARRLGFLIGRVRASRDQCARVPEARPQNIVRGRPRPSSPMQALAPAQHVPGGSKPAPAGEPE